MKYLISLILLVISMSVKADLDIQIIIDNPYRYNYNPRNYVWINPNIPPASHYWRETDNYQYYNRDIDRQHRPYKHHHGHEFEHRHYR